MVVRIKRVIGMITIKARGNNGNRAAEMTRERRREGAAPRCKNLRLENACIKIF
jgi:hypothetical protein